MIELLKGHALRIIPLIVLSAMAACADQSPVDAINEPEAVPSSALVAFDCVGSIAGSVDCLSPRVASGSISPALIGGQNQYVTLTSSNVVYDPGTEISSFDVTVTNLMNEAIGSPDGTVPDPEGIRVFFADGIQTTSGTGVVTVANPDGVDTFTRTNQPFFRYNGILAKNQTSAAKTWQLQIPATVSTFSFTLYLETSVQWSASSGHHCPSRAALPSRSGGRGYARQLPFQVVAVAPPAPKLHPRFSRFPSGPVDSPTEVTMAIQAAPQAQQR